MALIDRGDMFADLIQSDTAPPPPCSETLRGRTIINLFFENKKQINPTLPWNLFLNQEK